MPRFANAIFNNSQQKERTEINDFFSKIKTTKPDEIMEKADLLVDMINCAINNLMAGNSSTNRSIGKSNDPHTVDVIIEPNKPAILTPLPQYTEIKNAFQALAACFSLYFPEEDTICKSSTVSRNHKESFLDSGLFPRTMKGITNRQSDKLQQVKQDQRNNGINPYENSKFEDVCNDFETINQTGLTSFIAQYPELHHEITGQNLNTAAFQARMELDDEYGLNVDNLPSSLRRGIFSSDHDESEDEEDYNESENTGYSRESNKKCNIS